MAESPAGCATPTSCAKTWGAGDGQRQERPRSRSLLPGVLSDRSGGSPTKFAASLLRAGQTVKTGKIRNMWKVEFHCHTVHSPDSLTSPADLVRACRRKGLDRVVVTDHNTIAGALAAQAIDPQLVIVGEEIMTTQGELLAAYVQETIPAGLSPEEAVRRLRAQGAFISVSHPFDVMRSGHWDLLDLQAIVPHVDAIETFNARCMLPAFNRRAEAFARRNGLPGTAGSDAHAAFELGRAVLLVDAFHDARSLRECLPRASAVRRASPPWFHLSSRYAVLRKGWRARRGT